LFPHKTAITDTNSSDAYHETEQNYDKITKFDAKKSQIVNF